MAEEMGSEVVYGHRFDGETSYFHIGSGSERRARTLTGRSALWHNFVEARGGVDGTPAIPAKMS